MATIPTISTADEVLALVSAGTVTSANGAAFLAARFARKTRDGKAVTGRALAIFADMMGLPAKGGESFNEWRDGVLAVAIPLAGGLPAPKVAAPAKGKSAPKPKASAKTSTPAARGRTRTTKAAAVAADAPFTPTKAEAKVLAKYFASLAK